MTVGGGDVQERVHLYGAKVEKVSSDFQGTLHCCTLKRNCNRANRSRERAVQSEPSREPWRSFFPYSHFNLNQDVLVPHSLLTWRLLGDSSSVLYPTQHQVGIGHRYSEYAGAWPTAREDVTLLQGNATVPPPCRPSPMPSSSP